jgi:hypothetical protein
MGRRCIPPNKLREKYGVLLAGVTAGLSISQAAKNQGISPSYSNRILRKLGYRYKLIKSFADGTEEIFDAWR